MNHASSATEFGEAYFRELCDQLGMAVVATDPALNITLWNAAAGRLFGAAAVQMRGTTILSVFPQERRALAERMLRKALNLGEGSEFEFDYRDGTGRRREYAAAVAPIVNMAGERCGVSLCVRDITRRIALQTDLAETRKMASLGEMAGAIAHHFNNVLGGIITSIDYANQSHDPAITHRMLDQVSKALLRTSSLVNGLLAFSEGGPHEDDLSDLTELLNSLADETEFSLAGRGIEVSTGYANLPVIPVAREQMLIVLRNIIQNAVEAMHDGGVLGISGRIDADGIVVGISDTGRGMDDDAMSRMFEPFWTTKGALATVQGRAAGLGLAIAHGIVQRLGGTIRVHSQVGKGTTVEVCIPDPNQSEVIPATD
ncbi:MAG: two-component system sensor histidine kinase NtrB [Planctomycetaceae bacterium]